MTSIIDDPQALSDEDLQAAISALLDEASRRNAIATIPLQIADDIAAWQDMRGITENRRQNPDGSWPTWTQPTSALDAYREGDRVTHRGAVWESLIDANVWTPDAYPGGWDKVTP